MDQHGFETHSQENSLLVTQRNQVNGEHLQCQQDPCRLPVHDRGAKKGQRRSVVHWRIGDVERERCHPVIHENAKVIAQICAGNAQSPHATEHEKIAGGDQSIPDVVRGGRLQERVRWLSAERTFVSAPSVNGVDRNRARSMKRIRDPQCISENAYREDRHSQCITAISRVSSEQLCQDLVVVFCGIRYQCQQALFRHTNGADLPWRARTL